MIYVLLACIVGGLFLLLAMALVRVARDTHTVDDGRAFGGDE